MMFKFVVLAQLFCVAVLAQCPWTQTGLVSWSAGSTWPGGVVPGNGSSVTINSGQKVLYDVTVDGIVLAGITILSGGALIFDGTKNVILNTAFVNVNFGANFTIGSSTCHYPTKAVITLYGPRDTTTNVVPYLGNKGVFVQGLLDWYGTPPSPTWTTITATVQVNATTITVKDAISNWKVGDKIALASTDYYQQLTESFVITAISGQTITLNNKVNYLHWGANNQFAEVGHITRNIVVQGDPSSDNSTFGGHCITVGNGISHVYGVEFTRMGQANVLARYPFHWHYMGDQIGKGHFIQESSMHNNYQRCVTVHGTNGVLVQNNVGYNVTGHCFFMEEGSESWNTFNHNLGMVVNPGTMIPTDATPSIFWITNPNNTYTNNVAVGGQFGFWFSLPLHPIGMSSGQVWIYPRYTPLVRFDNNLAHSANRNGIHADDQLQPDGTTQLGGYSPLQPYPNNSYTAATQTYNTPAVRATLTGNNAYKNRQYGIWFKSSQVTIQNSLLQDNAAGVNTPATGNLVQNTIIVGETDNIGTPGFTQYFNDYNRSRPVLWNANYPIRGFEGYDSTGGQHGRNITFVNFTTNSIRRAGAVDVLPNGKNVLPPNIFLAQSTLINSNVWAEPDNTANADNPKFSVVIDTDGTLTGGYGNAITANASTLDTGGCTAPPAWNGYWNCTPTQDGYSQLVVVNSNTAGTDFGASVTSNWLYRAAFTPFGKPAGVLNVTGEDTSSTTRSSYTANVVSRHGYLLTFPHPTPPSLQVNLRFAATGEWVVVALPYPATTFSLNRGYSKVNLTQVSSLNYLTKSTYYYDATNQYLYVMYFEDNGGLVNNCGFPEYGYGASYINILAGCGTTCTVTAGHAVPSAWADTEDKYQVSVKGCSSGTTSTGQGTGYIRFNKVSHYVTYLIYHNVASATTAAIFVNGVLYQNLPVGQAPIRGGFEISWNKWNALWGGNWTVVIYTAAHPTGKGEISGTIGCVGTCAVPPAISAENPCQVFPNERALYLDGYGGNWSSWSYGTTINTSYAGDKRCGTYSLNALFNGYGSVSLHYGSCNPSVAGSCYASWQVPYFSINPFSYFQFNVRSPAGPIPTPLVISAQNGTGGNIITPGTSFAVNSSYIDNFVVEETWTRVKVPLSTLGFKGTELMGLLGIGMSASLSNYTLLLDDIKLVPSYSDPITAQPVGTVYNYNAAAC